MKTRKKSFIFTFKMLITIILFCLLNSVTAYKSDTKTDGVTFSQWLSLIISRGIYFVLFGLITICVILSTYKCWKEENRLKNETQRTRMTSDEPNEETNYLVNLWKRPTNFNFPGTEIFSGKSGGFLSQDIDNEALKEKLVEADISVAALRDELKLANKARLELEYSLENVERDKNYSDEELRKTKLEASLELEDMKKSITQLQRQLSQAELEKTELSKEMEALSRENRITDSALRDQKNLVSRLNEAKAEIKQLKSLVDTMKSERDTALKVATELVSRAKGVSEDSSQSRKMIRDVLEATSIPGFSSDLMLGIGDGVYENQEQLNEDESIEDISDPYNDLDDDEVDESKKLITNTPEFRAFLHKVFGERSVSQDI